MTQRHWLVMFITCCCTALAASADPTTQPAPANSEDAAPTTMPADSQNLLGPRFTSKAFGISFCPPIYAVPSTQTGPDTIAEYARDDYQWHFKAWRVELENPTHLSVHMDQFDRAQPGILEGTINNLQQTLRNAQVLRNEVITVGNVNVAMLAVRFLGPTGQRWLKQEAIIEVPKTDSRLFDAFDLTGVGKPVSEPEDIVNPAEKLAADTFGQIVDSVRLSDLSAIVEDQRQRLFAARSLFVQWDGYKYKAIRDAIAPQQWQLIVKDGQNIGWNSIVQDLIVDPQLPDQSHWRIGVRSHTLQEPNQAWDTQSWMKCTLDRAHESCTIEARLLSANGQLLDRYTHVITSNEKSELVRPDGGPAPNGALSDAGEPNHGVMDTVQVRMLQIISTHGESHSNPVAQQTPVFYLPEAFSYDLPYLLPRDRTHSYMFAVLAPSTGLPWDPPRTMMRYVDVFPPTDVEFNSQKVHAAIIEDRIGLEGPLTRYYLTPDGHFIGSIAELAVGDKPATIMALPTDLATLKQLFKTDDISGPTMLDSSTDIQQ